MPIQTLVEYCAPTLAGIKTANLFSYECDENEDIMSQLHELNRTFKGKGLKALVIGKRKNRLLIYVYRPMFLKKDMSDMEVSKVLHSLDYPSDVEKAVEHLSNRLKDASTFPHEIGFFLGYPPVDVLGFIRDGGKNYKYSGYYKVYGDKQKAIKTFEMYKACTSSMSRYLQLGKTLDELVVKL